MLNALDVLLAILSLAAVYMLYLRLTQRRQPPYPPGPPGYPLIGHLRAPEEPSWVTYRDWGLKYDSDIIHLNMAGTHLIVLNSLQACIDLLQKRSGFYSDRPIAGITMLTELCGLGWSFGLQRYGPEWRDGRKAAESQFNAHVVQRYRPALMLEVSRFLDRIRANPDTWRKHLKLLAGGLIMSVGYGIDVQEESDPYLTAAEHTSECFQKALVPGTYLVDVLHFLKYIPEWFPGAAFQQHAKNWRKSIMYIRDAPYDVVKERMADDPEATPDCIAKGLMEGMEKSEKDHGYMERVHRGVVGSMYLAGSDTTEAIIASSFLALVRHPEIQKRAQTSIDEVCQGRLPNFTDFDRLPYVDALVREGLRWNPAVALNLPHMNTKDDVYKGYFIPANSIVSANIWAILQDPTVYPDPTTFVPERFLRTAPDGRVALDPSVPDPTHVAFGFGRRECPGRFMAYQSIWLALARLLAAFSIDRARDADGRPVVPKAEYVWGLTNHPKPFPCDIRPRSREHAALVTEALDVAEGRQ
ncbi:cytochrome P450 [Phanerochaete sordida]|uniref:Cytochrome P450 n=1 Tax=Phanerochaete sordida TaxID=48140 RepID=A0A9P3LLT5_9APHY|nr:cytochrome P450 [Phanerochaete sordida]